MSLLPKKICSKERIGRLIIGLVLLLISALFAVIGFFAPVVLSFIVALYLITTALIGSCLLYAVYKK